MVEQRKVPFGHPSRTPQLAMFGTKLLRATYFLCEVARKRESPADRAKLLIAGKSKSTKRCFARQNPLVMNLPQGPIKQSGNRIPHLRRQRNRSAVTKTYASMRPNTSH